jgi:hypothetical protein
MEDYEELLIECKKKLNLFDPNSFSKVDTKNYLENLRSILDYITGDINKKLSNPAKRPQFPYSKNATDFANSVNKNLPNLNVEKTDLYNLIESIQSFSSNDSWLTDLCELTNNAKHNNLLQTQEDLKKGIFIPGFIKSVNSEVFIDNLKIGGETFKNFQIKDDNLSYENPNVILDFEVINEKSIKFADNQYDIKEFLSKCTDNIEKFTTYYKKNK